jgi:hypothetical protein
VTAPAINWIPLGETGMQVNAARLDDHESALRIAAVLDYYQRCSHDGTRMEYDRIKRILDGAR